MRRRPFIIGLSALALSAVAGGYLFLQNQQLQQTASVGGPFSLIDGDGRRVTEADFKGKWLMIFFGYTFCPDACPTALGAMAETMDRMGAQAERIQPIFITIDPERDTPQVMKDYVGNFGSKIVGLTGTSSDIAQVAQAFRVYYKKAGDGPNYMMDHSTAILVMNPDFHFAGIIAGDAKPAQMIERLNKIMSEGSPS
jgi:cytochrome oxidase Cu insertion factor (SCO1/SenC/PrrC family)